MEPSSTPSSQQPPTGKVQIAGPFVGLRPSSLNCSISTSSKSKRPVAETSIDGEDGSEEELDFNDRLTRIEKKVADLVDGLSELVQVVKAWQLSNTDRPPNAASSDQRASATQPTSDRWPTPGEASASNPASRITTVWGKHLDDAVKNAGLVERLNLKPPSINTRPSSYETLIVIGVQVGGRTWDEKRAKDKEAVQSVLNAIGIEKGAVVSTYRFNPAKEASHDPKRSLHPPIRVQMASKEAVHEALRRAHRLRGTQFGQVFLRRDLSKEDKELDVLARKTRDEKNKELASNNVTNFKFVVPNSGKVGRIVLVDHTKHSKKSDIQTATNGDSATASQLQTTTAVAASTATTSDTVSTASTASAAASAVTAVTGVVVVAPSAADSASAALSSCRAQTRSRSHSVRSLVGISTADAQTCLAKKKSNVGRPTNADRIATLEKTIEFLLGKQPAESLSEDMEVSSAATTQEQQ